MTRIRRLALLYGMVIAGAVLFLMIVTDGAPPGGIYLFSVACGVAGGAVFDILGARAAGRRKNKNNDANE